MSIQSKSEWGEAQTRTVTYWDPTQIVSASAGKSGLDALRAIQSGDVPPAPIGLSLGGMQFTTVEEGLIEIESTPDTSLYNPIGVVHGGYASTLLDSAGGCAVHTTLPPGFGYTTIELKVSFLRAIHGDGRPLLTRGWVVKPGKRVAFAEAEILDADGVKLATASTSCLVMDLRK